MKDKERVPELFDPNGVGVKGSIFGLPFQFDDSKLIIIPVPWDVTVSYREGTSKAPQAILEASTQIDFFQPDIHDAWKMGVYMLPISKRWKKTNNKLRKLSEAYIKKLERGDSITYKEKSALRKINSASEMLNDWVYKQSLWILNEDKLPVIIGGEHSAPLGLLKALSEKYSSFGMLQIDAHADLRPSYEGFEHSHASIMYNALKLNQLEKIVQIGIRDVCQQEMDVVSSSEERVITYSDQDLKLRKYKGENWMESCDKIIENLPELVYISFDVDGLDPKLCPNTGTPVPGGLEFEESLFLIKRLVESGRKIIGFDLCETGYSSETDWDANVSARILYRLSSLMGVSQKWLQF